MGFASYIEDIQKRLDDDLLHFRQAIDVQPRASANPWDVVAGHKRQLDGLYLKAQRLLEDIHGMLDLATDPGLDVAPEVIALRAEKTGLEDELRRVRIQMQTQQAAADQREASLQQKIAREMQTRQDLEHKLRAYDVQLETDRDAFAAALDRFMPGPRNDSSRRDGGQMPAQKRRS